jgi:hypothetical protein
MAIDLKKLGGSNIEQLAFPLDIDEVEGEGQIDNAEAQRRSAASLQAFKMVLENDREKQKAYSKALKDYQKKLKHTDKSIDDLVEPEEPAVCFEWADDFYRLIDRGWKWRIAVYVAWAASPRMGRYPETQEKLATEILGLTSDRQIATWRSKNPGIDEVIALMQAMPMMDYRRDILKALAISASNPNHKASADRRTALTITGDFVPHMKIDDKRSSSDPLDKSDAELDEIIRRGGE